MRFVPLGLEGAWLVEPEPIADERGFFARSWCRDEFSRRGLAGDLVQCNISFNARLGTLRGLHYQSPPHAETKLVRCTRGRIFDVIVDIRKDSPSFGRWLGIDLSWENRRSLYIPRGFAHGFQTLEDATEVFYQMGETHHRESARGIRWDAPVLNISWPITDRMTISERDLAFPATL